MLCVTERVSKRVRKIWIGHTFKTIYIYIYIWKRLNLKSIVFIYQIYIYLLVDWLVFYDLSTLVGYLKPNSLYMNIYNF